MKWVRFVLLASAILCALYLATVAGRFLHEERMVDNCLSARHGSFDYSTMSCDLNENHVYVPYGVRHPHDGSRTVAACCAFLVLWLAYLRMRKTPQA